MTTALDTRPGTPMTAALDTRVLRITRWLLEQQQPRSTASVASDLGLSERVVRYRLDHIDRYLRSCGAELVRKRGMGLSVGGSPEIRDRIAADLRSQSDVPRVYTPEERARILLAALLWSAPAVVSLEDLHYELEVSKTSARRDLRSCEPWLARNGLPLARLPGKGIVVVGTERRIRQVIVQFILEAIPEEVLLLQFAEDPQDRSAANVRVPVGLRERVFTLPLRETAAIVGSSALGETLRSGRSDVVFALFLAVSVARIREGRLVSMEAGLQRSVMDHPIAGSVAGIVTALEELAGSALPAPEIAAVAEYLLGLDTLDTVRPDSASISAELVDEIMELAGERLHAALADDMELRRGLASHLERLSVRLRYGLPIHNPLLDEVRERYGDVFDAATEAAAVIESAIEAAVGADEIGFITMYLSGAMERARLRPRRRALIVCPSGMATVWVLVSRIQAEFPALDLVEVLSERGYDELGHDGVDLVISTVPLAENEVPVVVVSPLLSSSDVSRLTRYT